MNRKIKAKNKINMEKHSPYTKSHSSRDERIQYTHKLAEAKSCFCAVRSNQK